MFWHCRTKHVFKTILIIMMNRQEAAYGECPITKSPHEPTGNPRNPSGGDGFRPTEDGRTPPGMVSLVHNVPNYVEGNARTPGEELPVHFPENLIVNYGEVNRQVITQQ